MGKGGKGPGGGSGGLSGTTMGMIALFGGLVIIMGGLTIGDTMGWFGGGGQSYCGDVLTGDRMHEHSDFLVYLDSQDPYDFSPIGYTLEGGTGTSAAHFHHGSEAPNPVIHLEERRANVGCVFEAIGWSITDEFIQTGDGERYEAGDGYEIHILMWDPMDPEDEPAPADRGLHHPMISGMSYMVVYKHADDPFPDPSPWAGTAMHEYGG